MQKQIDSNYFWSATTATSWPLKIGWLSKITCQFTPPKTNMSPKKGLFQFRKYIFQPLILRRHVTVVFQGVVFCTWPLSLKHWRLAHIVTCRWSRQRQQVAGIDDWSITRVAAAVAPTFPRSTREPKGTLWTLKPQISILSRQTAYCQGQRKTLLELQQTSNRIFF